ncbi:MAG: hypothetical protein GX606_00755 [Elusimicrobia bacterium]|nr:hypothetical protein [Elusimicrobiota bacterium]
MHWKVVTVFFLLLSGLAYAEDYGGPPEWLRERIEAKPGSRYWRRVGTVKECRYHGEVVYEVYGHPCVRTSRQSFGRLFDINGAQICSFHPEKKEKDCPEYQIGGPGCRTLQEKMRCPSRNREKAEFDRRVEKKRDLFLKGNFFVRSDKQGPFQMINVVYDGKSIRLPAWGFSFQYGRVFVTDDKAILMEGAIGRDEALDVVVNFSDGSQFRMPPLDRGARIELKGVVYEPPQVSAIDLETE